MNLFSRQMLSTIGIVAGAALSAPVLAQCLPSSGALPSTAAAVPSQSAGAGSANAAATGTSLPGNISPGSVGAGNGSASSLPPSVIASALAQFQAMTPQQMQAIPLNDFRRIPLDVLRQYATPDNLAKLTPDQQSLVQSMLGCAPSTQTTQTTQTNQTTPAQTAPAVTPPASTTGPRRFGSDLFTNPPSTFAQVSDVPVPANYVMGPGDTIAVQLFGNQNTQFQLTVQRDGTIQFPNLGPIQVTGQSFDSMRDLLLDRISKQMIGTQASITLGSLRSIQIFVVGDVNRPGAYTVSSLSRMLNALFVSGGIADTGSYRRVQLKRGSQIVAVLDLYDLLLKGDSSKDAQLRPGDVLFVPPVGKSVTVDGGVLRPAIYELKGNERLSDVLAYAGGPVPGAYLSLTKVERIAEDDRHVVLDADPASAAGNLPMRDGDVVSVKSSLNRLDRMVAVKGYVNREQPFQWHPNLRISDVVSSSADLLPQADLNFALLIRRTGANEKLSVIKFRPREVFTHRHGPDDLELAPKDELRFFGFNKGRADQLADTVELLKRDSRAEASSPLITIKGAVQESGDYPLFQDMTLQDALDSAIGANKDAWLEAALVVRRDIRNNTVEVHEVSLLPDAGDLGRFRMMPSDTLIVFASGEDRQAQLAEVIDKLKQQATPSAPAKMFTISGQVKFPGEYPLMEGSTIQSAIALAGGFTEPAYPNTYEVTRQALDEHGRFTIKTIDLDMLQGVQGQSADASQASQSSTFSLLPRDTLVVRSQPGYQESETIELKGEVRFPGVYRAHRGELLSDLIKRAGGLTTFADPDAAIFTREELKAAEQARLDEIQADMASQIARLSLMKSSDDGKSSGPDRTLMLSSLSDKLSKLHGIGRLVIDLPRILANDRDVDVQVKNGDVLIVPDIRQEVIVLGEVNYPTSHRYKPGENVRDYLNLSGGFTQAADNGRVYVIRANGEVVANAVGWFTSKNVKAGDTIVVPLDLEPIRPIPLLTSITQIAGQIAITAASLKVIGAF